MSGVACEHIVRKMEEKLGASSFMQIDRSSMNIYICIYIYRERCRSQHNGGRIVCLFYGLFPQLSEP